MNKHTFLQTRSENMSISLATVLTITTSKTDEDDAWEAFKQAVTEWVKNTDEGKELWKESDEDLNIGDMLNYGAFSDPGFQQLLSEQGLDSVTAESISFDHNRTYDEILVNYDQLDEDEEE